MHDVYSLVQCEGECAIHKNQTDKKLNFICFVYTYKITTHGG